MDTDNESTNSVEEELRERFSSMPYRQLQKEATANAINGRLKKVDMVEALVRHLSLQRKQQSQQLDVGADAAAKGEEEASTTTKTEPKTPELEELPKVKEEQQSKADSAFEEEQQEEKEEHNELELSLKLPSTEEEDESGSQLLEVTATSTTATSDVANSGIEVLEMSCAVELKQYKDEEDNTDSKKPQQTTPMKSQSGDDQWLSSDDSQKMDVDEESPKQLQQQSVEEEEGSDLVNDSVNDENRMSMLSEDAEQLIQQQQEANLMKTKELTGSDNSLDSSATYVIDAAKSPSSLSLEEKRPLVKTQSASASSTPSKSVKADNNASSSSSTFRYNRFALIHAKEFGGMPSILETQERRQQRHAQLTANVPSFVQRLASPKKAPRPYQEFKQSELGKEPKKFKFGDGLPANSVAQFGDKPTTTTPNSSDTIKKTTPSTAHSMRFHTPGVDVKTQTMSASMGLKTPASERAKLTPIWSGRINKLATPKGHKIDFDDDDDEADTAQTSSTRSYTPHKGPFKYVDTTKMSDRELALYDRERRAKKAEEAQNSQPMEEDSEKRRSIFEL